MFGLFKRKPKVPSHLTSGDEPQPFVWMHRVIHRPSPPAVWPLESDAFHGWRVKPNPELEHHGHQKKLYELKTQRMMTQAEALVRLMEAAKGLIEIGCGIEVKLIAAQVNAIFADAGAEVDAEGGEGALPEGDVR